MSRSKRNASPVVKESRAPGWLWLLTGVILGAFIMFLLRLNDLREAPQSVAAKPKTEAPATETLEDLIPAPVFEFYDRFKEERVEVPQYDTPQHRAKAQQTHEYYLQVASFRTREDADSLRARLLLLNMEAQIETSKLSSGEARYRVIAGPFNNKSELARGRDTLVSNGLEYLTLTRSLP